MTSLKSTLGLNNGDEIKAYVWAFNIEGNSDYSDPSNLDVKIQSAPVIAPTDFALTLNEDD